MNTLAKKRDLDNKEVINTFINLLKLDNYKEYVADKYFGTYEEFITSPELKEVHAGFQSKTSIKENMFQYAYVVGKDVYVFYKADGINFMKKEEIGSSLDNGGLYNVITASTAGFIINKTTCYDKSNHNRKIFRQRDYMILTSAYTN